MSTPRGVASPPHTDQDSGWALSPLAVEQYTKFIEVKPLAHTGAGEWQGVNPGSLLCQQPPCSGPIRMARRPAIPAAGPTGLLGVQLALHGLPSPTVRSRLSAFPPPTFQKRRRCLFPKLPPRSCPHGLCGDWEGALRSRGRAGPMARGLIPKLLWGPRWAFVSLVRSLNRVEPKVRFYCKSRKILASQANPEISSVKRLWGPSWLFPRKLYDSWVELRAEPRSPLAEHSS